MTPALIQEKVTSPVQTIIFPVILTDIVPEREVIIFHLANWSACPVSKSQAEISAHLEETRLRLHFPWGRSGKTVNMSNTVAAKTHKATDYHGHDTLKIITKWQRLVLIVSLFLTRYIIQKNSSKN